MRIAGIVPESSVDGPGIRFTVFTQGCLHHCPGCHNPGTWALDGGREMTVSALLDVLDRSDGIVSGVTVSGGEPLLQPDDVGRFLAGCKERRLHTVLFSGYVYEDALKLAGVRPLFDYVDLMVDGPFRQELKNQELLFRGSSNQRLIDIPATLAKGRVVEWKRFGYGLTACMQMAISA